MRVYIQWGRAVLMASFLIFLFLFWGLTAFAQENKQIPIKKIQPKGTPAGKDTTLIYKGVKQRDIADVITELFHGKPAPEIDSITSRPELSLVPALGYTLVSRFAVVLSGNVAYRNGPKSRVSTITASASYTQNKQFIAPIQTSIWTAGNDLNFVGDYRYYQYPQNTYGLGSSGKIENEDPMNYAFARFYEFALKHVTGNWYAGAGYMMDDHWDISDKGNLNGTTPDYQLYGPSDRSISSGLALNVVHDSRDNSINPYTGWYGSLQYRTSLKMMGSTNDWNSLLLDVRKYYRLPAGSDNILAFWTYDWLVLAGKPPYLDLPSTSWDTNSATGRGYIQGRFRGDKMVYLESEYRFKITRDGLYGGVLFINAQSLSAAPGTKLQTIQPGFGPGLRIKLNKISRTNLAIDYGFGRQGSNGLFIDVAEVF